MLLKVWRFLTLLLAALALTMTSAHVLELPVKMRYDTQFYTAVNGSLYRYFALVGAVYTLGSIITALVLVFLVRSRRPAFRWTLAGATCLLLAFGSWLVLVLPVNLEIAEVLRRVPGSAPAVWARLRPRWEYGHAAGFVLQLSGFSALAVAIISETEGGHGELHAAP
ncbi:MAG TPA: hypothetical protein VIE44_17980 [Methylomirabilota bacterium]|jgi:hypothetical protein